jgi:DNA-directed RNA polymerase specialized sigma24 family protein
VLADGDDTTRDFADLAVDPLDEQALAEWEDLVQSIRAALPELERQIFDLKLLELSNREIATRLERPARTIDRKVNGVILPQVLAAIEMG